MQRRLCTKDCALEILCKKSYCTVLQQFKLFVQKNAGNDATGLISSFLNTREAKSEELLKKIVFEDARIRILFESLANASNKSEAFQKRQFLSIMRKAGFSRTEEKTLDFL